MIALGHIAGIPVEETLLGLAPVGVAGIGAMVYAFRGHSRRMRARLRRRLPRD
jgi:hypothetical protein